MSKGTFFNKIGVADMERVHSAVIGWMLSDECEAFDITIRSQILKELFGINDTNRSFVEIQSLIEWKDIDILILTKDEQGNGDCWIIENKIKTSQHSNQLEKYIEIINKDFSNREKHFAFLTLIGESALNKGNQWINITYQLLVSLLEKNLHLKMDNVDSVILNEYYLSIQQLCSAAVSFISNPQSYPTVFEDGYKSKEQKQQEAEQNPNKYNEVSRVY